MPSGPSPACVLVVDDDYGIRWVLAAALTTAGYLVVDAADGEQAIDVALHARPDVLIVDLVLPKKHGLDVIAELRSRGVHGYIIAITGFEPELDAVRAVESGADMLLGKPLDLDVLEAHIRGGIRRVRQYASTTPVSVGDLTYHPITGEASRGKRRFTLSQIERTLTMFGTRHAGRALSVIELWRAAWAPPSQIVTDLSERDIHAVEVAMSRLAAKLNGPGESRMITTSRDDRRRRIGYLFAMIPIDGAPHIPIAPPADPPESFRLGY